MRFQYWALLAAVASAAPRLAAAQSAAVVDTQATREICARYRQWTYLPPSPSSRAMCGLRLGGAVAAMRVMGDLHVVTTIASGSADDRLNILNTLLWNSGYRLVGWIDPQTTVTVNEAGDNYASVTIEPQRVILHFYQRGTSGYHQIRAWIELQHAAHGGTNPPRRPPRARQVDEFGNML